MCGICGAIGFNSRESGEAIVRRMLRAIIHRGPDEEGVLASALSVAGSRRLSIIDLPGGSQPIWNETNTLAVFFNGEIYNFLDLRKELEGLGHKFRTRSDTEIIVHAYEEWREDCLPRLHGMFGFAVVEMPQGPTGQTTRVFLARDPLGIKPLYYVIANGVLLFASEVRALLASGCVPAQICTESISSYLLFGSVGEPMTLVEGVFSLPPGHWMAISTDDPVRKPEPKSYWKIADNFEAECAAKRPAKIAFREAASHVRTLLESSVRRHLVADVPVGVFLSSGLDSTALAALASRLQGGIHTFTVAFPDEKFSEAEIARRTVQHLGTDHKELVLSGDEMVARLEEAISAFDQPSMDGINTYFVSWAARQAGLKVALSGLGSDELFGGYSTFKATSHLERLSAMARVFPSGIRGLVSSGIKKLEIYRPFPDSFRKPMAACLDPEVLPHPYFFTRALFTPQTVASCLQESMGSWNSLRWFQWLATATEQSRPMDSFTRVSWLELRSYLVNTLLRDTDTMSMRNSLEVRVPFLDSPLVEHVLALPEFVKRGSGRPKSLLVEALGDLLPKEIVNQPKRTFTFPWESWMRSKLGERVAAGLEDWAAPLQPYLNSDFPQTVWRNFLRGGTTWSRPWSLYVLNEWVKRNLCASRTGDAEDRKTATIHVS